MFRRVKESFKKKEIDEDKKDVELEKGDFLALMIAAAYYIIPVVLISIGIIALIIYVMFGW